MMGLQKEKRNRAKKTQIRVIKRMLKENFDKNIIKKIANATDKDIEEARMAK